MSLGADLDFPERSGKNEHTLDRIEDVLLPGFLERFQQPCHIGDSADTFALVGHGLGKTNFTEIGAIAGLCPGAGQSCLVGSLSLPPLDLLQQPPQLPARLEAGLVGNPDLLGAVKAGPPHHVLDSV